MVERVQAKCSEPVDGAVAGPAKRFRRSAGNRGVGFTCGLALLALSALNGCSGHSSRTQPARDALDAGNTQEALALLNKELGVDNEKQLPPKLNGDDVLLVLDRAMVLQSLDSYQWSSRDLEAADKAVEILDFSRNSLDELGKYMFSDSSGPYKAPAYEKLLINTMNLVNYLVRGDLAGARIEARRLAVMQKFIHDHQDASDAMLGPGSYLAGFAFEKSGDPTEALHYYDEALRYSSYPSLEEPVQRLAGQSSYRSPRLRKLLGTKPEPESSGPSVAFPEEKTDGAKPTGSTAPAPSSTPAPVESTATTVESAPAPEPDDSGEILAVLSYGRVAPKLAQRVPIGLALTYASGYISPFDVGRANELAAQGLVTWVNYPELGETTGSWGDPAVSIGRDELGTEPALSVDLEMRRAWEKQRGAVVASAITRLVSRLVAGAAVRAMAGDKELLGILLSLGTQATLTAMDTPDTRSWSTLPARIQLARARVKPGTWTVSLAARDSIVRRKVKVGPRGFAVVNLTVLR